jgi:O-antigen/teichoic acid export membrane protein
VGENGARKAVIDFKRHHFFVKLFSSAILMQGLLSACSLCVGLLLIRRTTDVEYGFYVLTMNTVILMTALQNAYIQPSLVYCVTDPNNDRATRSRVVGGMYREQRLLLLRLAVVLLVIALGMWVLHVLDHRLLWIIIAGACAAVFTLYREFFRIALLAYRRPDDVLKGDMIYALLLVGGTYVATNTSTPAALTAGVLALAALVGGTRQSKSLQRHENWDTPGEVGVLRRIYSVGIWACFGAGTHWAFAQGYSYLVAGTLSVTSVAAIAATRTLIMPVNLISTGIGTFMFPTVSGWLQRISPKVVLRRMLMIAAALSVLAGVYLLIVWVFRDWVFSSLLRKHFAQQNQLLALWFLVAIAMLLRDQLGYIVVARARFRVLSALTLACAVLSLSTSYVAMRHYGEIGALCGLLVGELTNVLGMLLMSWREVNIVPASSSSMA